MKKILGLFLFVALFVQNSLFIQVQSEKLKDGVSRSARDGSGSQPCAC
jgi:hypothetical protein